MDVRKEAFVPIVTVRPTEDQPQQDAGIGGAAQSPALVTLTLRG